MPSTPTGHYSLTSKQLTILKFLYRFRFATSQLLAQSTDTNKDVINKRLKLMLQLNYVGRKFDAGYRLQRKHATYYLTSTGITALKYASGKNYDSKTLRNIAKDNTKSERFIGHQLAVFDAYYTLRAMYGERLQFFTRTQLAGFNHYPQPLPDAYILITTDDKEKHFFLSLFSESDPLFVCTRAIKQYMAFADENHDDWEHETNTDLPDVLFICDTVSLKNRLLKKMRRSAADMDDDTYLYISNIESIADPDSWHNMADPEQPLSLSDLS